MVVKLGCKFFLEMYPFDSQLCPIKLNKDIEQEPQFGLKWEKLPTINNSIELLQFDVMNDLYYNTTNAIHKKPLSVLTSQITDCRDGIKQACGCFMVNHGNDFDIWK